MFMKSCFVVTLNNLVRFTESFFYIALYNRVVYNNIALIFRMNESCFFFYSLTWVKYSLNRFIFYVDQIYCLKCNLFSFCCNNGYHITREENFIIYNRILIRTNWTKPCLAGDIFILSNFHYSLYFFCFAIINIFYFSNGNICIPSCCMEHIN